MAAPCVRCRLLMKSMTSRQIFRAGFLRGVRFLSTEGSATNGQQTTTGAGQGFKANSQAETENGKQSQEKLKTYFQQFDDSWSEETETEYQTKQRILKASLPFIHQYGWTQKALAAGAEKEGLPSVAHGMFPRGGVELVFYLYGELNKQMSEKLKAEVEELEKQQQKLKTGPFIRKALETRLRMIIPYLDKWPQAMAIQTLPQNAMESWSNLGNLVDEIWYFAGDQSNDFNWYTKRVSLGAVYKSSEIFMVQDSSEDFQDTWEFLDRRLRDVTNAGKFVHNAQQNCDVLSEGLVGMCIMTRNIFGMNSKFR